MSGGLIKKESTVERRGHCTPKRVASPCVDVCELDKNDVCIGCLRTADEVGHWLVASNAEKLRILQAIEVRRAQAQGKNPD